MPVTLDASRATRRFFEITYTRLRETDGKMSRNITHVARRRRFSGSYHARACTLFWIRPAFSSLQSATIKDAHFFVFIIVAGKCATVAKKPCARCHEEDVAPHYALGYAAARKSSRNALRYHIERTVLVFSIRMLHYDAISADTASTSTTKCVLPTFVVVTIECSVPSTKSSRTRTVDLSFEH